MYSNYWTRDQKRSLENQLRLDVLIEDPLEFEEYAKHVSQVVDSQVSRFHLMIRTSMAIDDMFEARRMALLMP